MNKCDSLIRNCLFVFTMTEPACNSAPGSGPSSPNNSSSNIPNENGIPISSSHGEVIRQLFLAVSACACERML